MNEKPERGSAALANRSGQTLSVIDREGRLSRPPSAFNRYCRNVADWEPSQRLLLRRAGDAEQQCGEAGIGLLRWAHFSWKQKPQTVARDPACGQPASSPVMPGPVPYDGHSPVTSPSRSWTPPTPVSGTTSVRLCPGCRSATGERGTRRSVEELGLTRDRRIAKWRWVMRCHVRS